MRSTNCDLILNSSRYNEICEVSLGFYEFVKVRFDEGEPLFYATFHVTATMVDISENLRSVMVSDSKNKPFPGYLTSS